MTECIYPSQCKSYPIKCKDCGHNKGKQDYFKPKEQPKPPEVKLEKPTGSGAMVRNN